jgi:hypothetical protein
VLPTSDENFPPAQGSQEDSLDRAWNCPGWHTEHQEAPFTAAENPAAHAMHVLIPLTSAYLPDSQREHAVCPDTLALPSAQRGHSTAVSATENEPALQGLHVVALVALLVKEPAPQVRQEPVNGWGAKRPLSQ